jgi:hypothetical protein
MNLPPGVPNPDIFELSPLGHAYALLVAENYPPKVALYMAWKAHPKELRKEAGLPEKQIDLAKSVLMYTSDTPIRNWRKSYPQMEDRIASLIRQGPLSYYRPLVLHTLGLVATMPDPKAHSDRKLFLEMTGDYTPKSITAGDPDEPLTIKITYADDHPDAT